MTVYAYKDNEVVIVDTFGGMLDDEAEEHGLTDCYLCDTYYSNPDNKWGMFKSINENDGTWWMWQNIPKSDMPKEFLIHLHLLGVD